MKTFEQYISEADKNLPPLPRSEKIKNKKCMFCGEKLGDKEISSWYNGVHAACLNKYNRGKR